MPAEVVDGFLVFCAGVSERADPTQREAAVADAAERVEPVHESLRVECLLQVEPCPGNEMLVSRVLDPRCPHIVIAFLAPCLQFIAEYPHVGLADENILHVGKQVVKFA